MSGVALEFRPPVTAARLCTKDKYLEPMFGDVGQARTNAAMLLLPIATTSSRICTKPIVIRLCIYFSIYFSVIFKANKFIYLKIVKAIKFINCQNVKSACIKSKLSNRKTTANKIQLKIKSPKSYRNEFYNCRTVQ